MYSVPIDKYISSPSFGQWLKKIIASHLGTISESSVSDKPVCLPPLLSLQPIIEEREMNDDYYRSYRVSENLHEITFFIGGESLSVEETDFHKQINYPISTDSYLDAQCISNFLEKNNIHYLQQINIVRGNLSSYNDLEPLLKTLSHHDLPTTFMLKGDDYTSVESTIGKYTFTDLSFDLFYTDSNSLKVIEKKLSGNNTNHTWVFLIKEENDLSVSERLISTYQIKKYKLVPVIKKDLTNLPFFERNIYTSYEELSQITHTKQNIFCNQAINSNYWGKLYITPERKIYANLNEPALGEIDENVLKNVREAMIKGKTSWRCTREIIQPCKSCLYRDLCPPPSSYEFYLNKFDMCTIKQ